METKQITKQNFQKILDTIIDKIKSTSPSNKPTLLLHACCAPCSSYVIEYLSQYFEITILYYNPNIHPQEEYNRRLEELINFLPKFNPAIQNNVKLVKLDYDPQEFYDSIHIKEHPELATEKEKGILRGLHRIPFLSLFQLCTEHACCSCDEILNCLFSPLSFRGIEKLLIIFMHHLRRNLILSGIPVLTVFVDCVFQ